MNRRLDGLFLANAASKPKAIAIEDPQNGHRATYEDLDRHQQTVVDRRHHALGYH